MNTGYLIVSAKEFLRLLDGKWRFVSDSVLYGGSHKKVEPIKKILIVPTCTEDCEDGNSPSIEEIFREIQKTGTESSILLIGTCCGIRKDKIKKLRRMTTLDILVPDKTFHDSNQLSLDKKSLKEQAKSLATRLRTIGLMQKMDWC